jgi:arylsulfatase A-like enzyme
MKILSLFLSFLAIGPIHAATKKPNIVIILADDLGYGDVQCYNPQRGKIPTPNIDRLAKQGMRFTDGHSSSGVCSPSRYTLLTGRYHWRTSLQKGIVGVFGEPLIAPDRMTIGTLAKQHGYRTATIGKWHLGWDWPIAKEQKRFFQNPKGGDQATIESERRGAWNKVFSKPILGGPTTRGFDEYFGTDVPNWPPFCFIENDRTRGIPSELLPKPLLENNLASQIGPALKDWQLEGILPAITDRACSFISKRAAAKENFLLYLPLTTPHTPLSVNEAWRGKSGLDSAVADLTIETDAMVGRVLDALEKSGTASDTLVIFTSDNGFAPYVGLEKLEKQGHFPSGPLRGYKGDAWEGGHRVPFMARWPGVVKPSSVCDQLVHQADMIRTLADILGMQLPDNAGEDSFSFLAQLKGDVRPIRPHAISCSAGGVPTLRDGAWKLIAAPSGNGVWNKSARIQPATPVLVFNLDDDLGETRNLAAEKPDRVSAMQASLEKLITNGRSTPGPIQKNDVEVFRFPAKPRAPKAEKK